MPFAQKFQRLPQKSLCRGIASLVLTIWGQPSPDAPHDSLTRPGRIRDRQCKIGAYTHFEQQDIGKGDYTVSPNLAFGGYG